MFSRFLWVRTGLLLAGLLASGAAAAWTQTAGGLPEAPSAIAASAQNGEISGVVEDTQGALIVGAQVMLREGKTTRQTVSAGDGRFVFAGVRPGAFTVTAKERGMEEDGVRSGTLAAQQQMELPPIVLSASAAMEVDAVTPEQMAALQVHAEEEQRIGGVIPNYYVVYDHNFAPLPAKLKFQMAWRSTIDPVTIAFVAGTAAIEQADGAFPGYGPGPAGYGKRFGAGLADTAIGTVLSGAVLPVLFRQDPRYFYKGVGSVKARTWYALRSAVVAKGDNGRWQPAYANVLGSFGSGAISNLYYPPGSRGASLVWENGLISIGFDGFSNLMQEFVIRRLTPKNKGANGF